MVKFYFQLWQTLWQCMRVKWTIESIIGQNEVEKWGINTTYWGNKEKEGMIFGSGRGTLRNVWINVSCFRVIFDLVLKRYELRIGWERRLGFQELHVWWGKRVLGGEEGIKLGNENRLRKEVRFWRPWNF